MYDLVLNDDGIFKEQPNLVRKTFGDKMNILDRLIEFLDDASTKIGQASTWDLRETILLTLFRVFQICPDKLSQSKYTDSLLKHK